MGSKLQLIRFLKKSKLARNTGWMLLGQGLKLVAQALYFTVIARLLGPAKYGAFIGVVGLVGILLPFATLGSGYVLIQNVARNQSRFRENWGRVLSTTSLFSTILLVIVTLASRFVLPKSIPPLLVVVVAAADLLCLSMTNICAQAFVAFDRLEWTALISVALSTSRLVAALILASVYRGASALQWGVFYFASSAIVAILACAWASLKLGFPTFRAKRTTLADATDGIYYSASQSAQTIYNDIDKAMLARLTTLEATGIYGAAYRLIDVSFAPVWSLLTAAYPNFFRVGAGGIVGGIRYAKPLMVRAFAYCSFVTTAFLAGAGIVPHVLGREYAPAVEALRWLAVLPLLKVIHSFLSDALAGAGHQRLRTLVHITVAAFNVLINFWLIPAYSWRGAAWSSIASEGVLACGMAWVVWTLSRETQSKETSARACEVRAEA